MSLDCIRPVIITQTQDEKGDLLAVPRLKYYRLSVKLFTFDTYYVRSHMFGFYADRLTLSQRSLFHQVGHCKVAIYIWPVKSSRRHQLL